MRIRSVTIKTTIVKFIVESALEIGKCLTMEIHLSAGNCIKLALLSTLDAQSVNPSIKTKSNENPFLRAIKYRFSEIFRLACIAGRKMEQRV